MGIEENKGGEVADSGKGSDSCPDRERLDGIKKLLTDSKGPSAVICFFGGDPNARCDKCPHYTGEGELPSGVLTR